MENKNLTCHIIGLNYKNKKKLLDNINIKIFNIIDLDKINQKVIDDQQINKLYLQFMKLKETKNDKYKEIEKKMTSFWESSFLEKINLEIASNKKNIFLGSNNHYKIPSKKISLSTLNNFCLISDPKEEIKIIIENNLDNNREEIINGNFPIEYLDYDFLLKKREALINTYIKKGYLEKKLDDIILILKALETDNQKDELWVSLKEPYNLNTKIHPINNLLYAYNDPSIALIESFNFEDGEIEKIITTESESTIQTLSLKEIKPNTLDKLKKKRFLYSVDKKLFLPTDNTKTKYFTQTPVNVNNKIKIDNVYNHLNIK
jgi:hypothetical protein